MNVLYELPYSPWSERARWALDHHGIPYERRAYVPMLSEPGLRLHARRPFGRVTVPVLVTPDGAIGDSIAIARFAEARGRGASLFPASHEAEIAAWIARTEVVLEAARGRVVRETAKNEALLLESVPAPLRGVRPLAGLLTRQGIAYFERKYALTGRTPGADRAAEHAWLVELRGALAGGRETLLPTFTFADVVAATAFAMVSPVADVHLPITRAMRATWHDAELAEAYADLVAWRDRLYARHRRA